MTLTYALVKEPAEFGSKLQALDAGHLPKFPVAPEALSTILSDERTSIIEIRTDSGKKVRIGYAIITSTAVIGSSLKKHDLNFKPEQDVGFLESLNLPGEFVDWQHYDRAFKVILQAAQKMKWTHLDLCISQSNNFSAEVQKRFRAEVLRSIPNYRGVGETYDYLRISLANGGGVPVDSSGDRELAATAQM